MKLKEGIKKEDLYGVAIKVSKDVEENNQLQQLLLDVGFTWQGGDVKTWPMTKGYIQTMPYGPIMVFVWDVTPFSTFKEMSLSDLVEEEYPKYLRCIESEGAYSITEGKIYKFVSLFSDDMITIANDKDHKGEYFKRRFVPATEEEYLAYQASLNPLKQVDDEWDKMKNAAVGKNIEIIPNAEVKTILSICDDVNKAHAASDTPIEGALKEFHKTFSTDKTFAISDDQIRKLVNLFNPDTLERRILSEDLKEWFPAASVFAFKKEKKTYKIGDRFKETKEDKEYILCNAGSVNQVVLVCLEDGYSYTYSAYVKDVRNITKEEMEYIAGEDRFKNFVLLP